MINKIQIELEKARDRATTYLHDSPGRAEAMERIAALEQQLGGMQKAHSKIAVILSGHGVQTIKELVELQKKHENTITATGNRLWQELLLIRGLGKYGAEDRTRWLPSDLIKVGSFPAQEKQARKEIDEAKLALPKVIDDMKTITILAEESGINPE